MGASDWIYDGSGAGWQSWVCTMIGPSPLVTPALDVSEYEQISVLVSGHKGGLVSSWHLEGRNTVTRDVFAPLNSLSLNPSGGASDAIALSLGSGVISPVLFAVLEPCLQIRAVTGGVGDALTSYLVSVLLQTKARR